MNRLILTEEQSECIRQSGVRFAVIHPGSYPATAGRFVLDLMSCDYKQAVDAIDVATSKARAVRPRKSQKPSSST